jgi:hypothetical protein
MAELRGGLAAVGGRGGNGGGRCLSGITGISTPIALGRLSAASGAFRQNWTQVLSLMPTPASVRRTPPLSDRGCVSAAEYWSRQGVARPAAVHQAGRRKGTPRHMTGNP